MIWRSMLTAADVNAYCWQLISFCAVEWLLRHVDLRSA